MPRWPTICSRWPTCCLDDRGYGESWRLQILDRPEGPARLRGRLGLLSPDRQAHRSMPTASRSSITCPRAFAAAESDGQRWRWCLEQAAEMDPQQLDDARMRFAELSAGAVRRADDGPIGLAFRPHGDRRHARQTKAAPTRCTPWAKTRRSPGWPPASSGSSCPTSSTTSRSTSKWPPSREAATPDRGASERAGPDLRESPAVSQGGRLLAAAVEGASRRHGRRRKAGSSGSTRSSATGAASSRARPSRPAAAPRSNTASATAEQIEFTAHEIKVEKLLDDVKAYLKSQPGKLDWQKDQHRRHRLPAGRQRTRSNTSAGRWPSGR